MRKLAVAILLSVVAVALLAVPGAARLEKAEMTTAALIGEALNRGDLSHDEMILQKAYALYAPWKVREDLAGVQTDKCGTPMDDEIRLALADLPDAVAEEIRGLRARPVCQTYIETAHFRIHYDTSGTHTILSAAYLDSIAVAVENVWDGEVTTMGFRAPPPDGGDPDGGGGNSLYDVYVQQLGTGLYGYCQGSYWRNDLIDLDHSIFLSMACFPFVVFTAFLFEYRNLFTLNIAETGCFHLCVSNFGSSDNNFFSIRTEKNPVKHHCGSFFSFDRGYL